MTNSYYYHLRRWRLNRPVPKSLQHVRAGDSLKVRGLAHVVVRIGLEKVLLSNEDCEVWFSWNDVEL